MTGPGGAAALAYAAICAGVVLFHLAVIAGAPLGAFTQGGRRDGPLPVTGRIGAGVAALVLLGMGGGILSAAGLWPSWPGWTGWVALGLTGLSVVLNGITPSRKERRLWLPVTALMLALALGALFG